VAPHTQALVVLTDGIVTEEVLPATNNPRILSVVSKPTFDSVEAIRQVKAARQEMTGARGKGAGFQFILEPSEEGASVVIVRGEYHNNPAVVKLNAMTGAFLTASVMTLESGGVLFSQDSGQTWQASDLTGRMINEIAADPLFPDQGYAVTPEADKTAFYRTQDGGQSWQFVSTLPSDAGNWPLSLLAIPESSQSTRLLIGTKNGLWSSTDGSDWSSVTGLPEGPKRWMAVAQAPTGYRVFVSITAEEGRQARGLYASTDLAAWDKVADIPYRLSESFNRTQVLATDEQHPNQTLMLDAQQQQAVKLPGSVLRATGDFDGTASMIFFTPSSGVGTIARSVTDIALPDFEQVESKLAGPIASFATPHNFMSSQRAIAGGFRTGIFLTTDSGQTWNQVVANPSDVVDGSGEIIGVAFLSPTNVIAVNGARVVWQNF
jgi:photosystem II stability/assembly factor-like uncharacterized protein